MNRSDGYKLKGCDPFYQIIPYIMDKRYDATNYIDIDLDAEPLQSYINKQRQKGISLSHLSVFIASYLRLVSQNPNLNRFVVNKRIYGRNHFCVSFVTLKSSAGESNTGSETVVKIYFNMDDDIFEVNRKINVAVEQNRKAGANNAMDRLLKGVMRIPFLARGTVGFLKCLDRYIGLPFSIVHGSPFHTSLFITNMASIRINAVYHHNYQFGTTGIFIALGQPAKKVVKQGDEFIEKKVIPVKVSTDERIESGYYFGRCFKEFKSYLNHPEILEEKPEKVYHDPNVKKKNPKFIVK